MIEIDFKDKQDQTEEELQITQKNKRKRRLFIRFFSYLTIFTIIGFALFSNTVLTTDRADSFIDRLPFLGQFRQLVNSSDKPLKGEEDDRINILLLGMGGKNHDGGYLTDTIILASLKPSEKKVFMLSIPRDLSIPVESGQWTKVNNINAFAEFKEAGSGGVAISQALSDLLDIPIDYYLRVDFQGFIDIIDKLGGIEVEVENTLNDYSYPIMGQEKNPEYDDRFEHLYVKKGLNKMDGSLALKYARSRHAAGIEGSDFARARRQQLIIQAARDKILETNFFLKPQILTGIIGELANHLSTNIKVWEIIKLWGQFKDINQANITTRVLDNGPNGLLRNFINEQGAYTLVPNSGDFAEIKYLVHNVFSDVPAQEKEDVTVERSTIDIKNGTWINGLASQKAVDLEKYGFDVIGVGNSSRKNFEKSIIYDLSFGEKINSLKILKEKMDASVSLEIPEWLKNDIADDIASGKTTARPDFILIIGQSADPTRSGIENKEE